MALNTLKCNHLTPLHVKGLTALCKCIYLLTYLLTYLKDTREKKTSDLDCCVYG